MRLAQLLSSRVGVRSACCLTQPENRNLVDVLQRQSARGVEEPGEVARGDQEAVDDVDAARRFSSK